MEKALLQAREGRQHILSKSVLRQNSCKMCRAKRITTPLCFSRRRYSSKKLLRDIVTSKQVPHDDTYSEKMQTAYPSIHGHQINIITKRGLYACIHVCIKRNGEQLSTHANRRESSCKMCRTKWIKTPLCLSPKKWSSKKLMWDIRTPNERCRRGMVDIRTSNQQLSKNADSVSMDTKST
jgi:hypothetical protein